MAAESYLSVTMHVKQSILKSSTSTFWHMPIRWYNNTFLQAPWHNHLSITTIPVVWPTSVHLPSNSPAHQQTMQTTRLLRHTAQNPLKYVLIKIKSLRRRILTSPCHSVDWPLLDCKHFLRFQIREKYALMVWRRWLIIMHYAIRQTLNCWAFQTTFTSFLHNYLVCQPTLHDHALTTG